MCQLQQLEAFLASRNSTGEFKPMTISQGTCDNHCKEHDQVVDSIATFLKGKICSSFEREGQIVAVQEENYTREWQKFSELIRITSDKTLAREDKVSLISRPTKRQVLEFVEKLNEDGRIEYQSQLYARILIERLLKKTGWTLRATNWRILWIVATRLAQKIEAKPVLSGSNLSHIYPLFTGREFNSLEHVFLRLIDYDSLISYEEFASELKKVCV